MSSMTALKQQLSVQTSQRALELQLQLVPFVRVVLKTRLLQERSLEPGELPDVSSMLLAIRRMEDS